MTNEERKQIEEKIEFLLSAADGSTWGNDCAMRAEGMIEALDMLGYPCRIEGTVENGLYLHKSYEEK